MNITLIGLSGTGKTLIASLLARNLGKKLVSTDDELVKKTKLSIPKIVKKYGLNKFQELETEVIENMSDFDECIFDAGEMAVMRNENITNLKKNSLIILLTADTKTMASRMRSGKKPALIKSSFINGAKNVFEEYESKCKKAADYTIDTSRLQPEEVCGLIMHYIQMELQ